MTRIFDKYMILPADSISIIPALIEDPGIQHLASGHNKDSS
jgi:hypothetical protein